MFKKRKKYGRKSRTNLSDPDPAGGAYSAPPYPQLDLRGPTSLPTYLLLTHVALCQRVRGVIARTRYIKVLTDLLTYISSTIGCESTVNRIGREVGPLKSSWGYGGAL